MAEPLRHRQTKEAATDMFGLQPPRHIPTLPILLQKSFCTGGQKFCGLQARLSCKDVRDLIASR
jgi:hypothetical protein